MSYNLNKPIKVLQLGSPTGLYGAERWILALIRNLDPQKVESIVGVIKDEPGLEAPLCSAAEKLGFQTITLNAYGKVSFSAITQLRRYIIKSKIDILHTHWYKTDIIGYLATRGTICKIISTPHGWSRNAGFKLQCYEFLDRMIFPLLDAVVPLSQDLHDNLKWIPFFKNKLHLIQNGVDTLEIEECKIVDSQIAEWKKQGFVIIGYIGQLIHRKGLDILFKAASRLNEDIQWKIILIGDGEQRDELETLAHNLKISDQVHFLGFKNNRLEFLNGFDVFVLPSRLEGIPRCLMESMGAGIPVIASNIPGCTDLIKHDVTGRLFSSENDTALANQLAYVSTNKKDIKKLSMNASLMITEKYSAKRMSQQYELLYASPQASERKLP